MNLNNLTTEKRNSKSNNLDQMNSLEIVKLMNSEDKKVLKAIGKEKLKISKAIDYAINSLKNKGRIIYMGAGTSGRLGILDAVECAPTFGVNDNTVIGLIAGGDDAIKKAQEGVEDDELLGVNDLKAINLSDNDLLIGIAASGRTPYVIAGMKYAKKIGCNVVSITSNENSIMALNSDIAIELVVGPEVLTGSSRLKSGSAQKMVLNMISTGAMVGVGKVYKNLMVDLVVANEKLEKRAENIVIEATSFDREIVKKAIKDCKNDIKVAIVKLLLDISPEEAKNKLDSNDGHIRNTLLQSKEG